MKNIFDLDRLKEILDTLTRNRSRTILTGFGIFWGVFMLLAMSGGGKGLRTSSPIPSTDSPRTP